MKKVRRLSMEIGQKVIRSLENSTPTPQTQDSQPFSPSDSQSSQTSTVPSTVPPVGREEEIQAESDETPAETADTADTVTKIERVSPSPLNSPNSLETFAQDMGVALLKDTKETEPTNEPGMKGHIFLILFNINIFRGHLRKSS